MIDNCESRIVSYPKIVPDEIKIRQVSDLQNNENIKHYETCLRAFIIVSLHPKEGV